MYNFIFGVVLMIYIVLPLLLCACVGVTLSKPRCFLKFLIEISCFCWRKIENHYKNDKTKPSVSLIFINPHYSILVPVRMARIKKKRNNKCGKDVEKGNPVYCSCKCNWYCHYGKQCGLKILKI